MSKAISGRTLSVKSIIPALTNIIIEVEGILEILGALTKETQSDNIRDIYHTPKKLPKIHLKRVCSPTRCTHGLATRTTTAGTPTYKDVQRETETPRPASTAPATPIYTTPKRTRKKVGRIYDTFVYQPSAHQRSQKHSFIPLDLTFRPPPTESTSSAEINAGIYTSTCVSTSTYADESEQSVLPTVLGSDRETVLPMQENLILTG